MSRNGNKKNTTVPRDSDINNTATPASNNNQPDVDSKPAEAPVVVHEEAVVEEERKLLPQHPKYEDIEQVIAVLECSDNKGLNIVDADKKVAYLRSYQSFFYDVDSHEIKHEAKGKCRCGLTLGHFIVKKGPNYGSMFECCRNEGPAKCSMWKWKPYK